jgi:hypothetical protein
MSRSYRNNTRDDPPGRENSTGRSLTVSLLLTIAALVSVVAATVAWFTIADNARVRSMSMELTPGSSLRFDLDAHSDFEDYVKTLSFADIAARITQQQGFDPRTTPLEPVTSANGTAFFYEDGTAVSASGGAYLTFTLHFMATQDMLVHLTSANTAGNANTEDGTLVSSSSAALPSALRISFTAGGAYSIYDPGAAPGSVSSAGGKTFGLANAANMTLGSDNALFWLQEGVDLPVQVSIWLEGSDEACTDALRSADYSIRLRFIGTDADNNLLE